MQFLYEQDGEFHFMNTSNYEQVGLTRDQLEAGADWLSENLEVNVLFHNGRAISVDLPNFVELQITQCEPGVKGDTKSNTTKPATVSTGATVQVPLFVDEGEWIRIDTRDGSYVERVKK